MPAPVVAAGANSSIAEARPLALGVAEPGEILTTDDTRYYLVGNTLKIRDLVLVRLENLSATLRPNLKIFTANKSLITGAVRRQPRRQRGAHVAHGPGQGDLSAGAAVQHDEEVTRFPSRRNRPTTRHEPNDDLLNPKAIKVGDDISGSIMDGGDHDWFRVSGATGTMIKVTFENLSTTLKPNVKVYDRNKSNIAGQIRRDAWREPELRREHQAGGRLLRRGAALLDRGEIPAFDSIEPLSS